MLHNPETAAAVRTFFDSLSSIPHLSKHVQLPEVCVMGDTSSGKSSLLSAISGIELPSSSEITTRCPTRLRMEYREGDWKARVRIQWKSTNLAEDASASAKVENGWITDPKLITDVIAEAQKTILETESKEVSNSVVEVQLYGSNYQDLTLIDLPGIVRTVGKGESNALIDQIKALNGEYLQNERCVILAVVPANVDFHNSQILADALVVDPTTKRTAPVISKPDLVDVGAEHGVVDLLLGRKVEKNFVYGFHMVKCRSQKDINENKSLALSLDEEERFFGPGGHPVYSKVSQQELLGTQRLREKLSRIYTLLLNESLPGIVDDITAKCDEVEAELRQLGESYSSNSQRRAALRQLENTCIRLFEAHLEGVGHAEKPIRDKEGFTVVASMEVLKTKFSEDVLGTEFCCLDGFRAGEQVQVLVDGEALNGEILHKWGPDGPYAVEGNKKFVDMSSLRRAKTLQKKGEYVHLTDDNIFVVTKEASDGGVAEGYEMKRFVADDLMHLHEDLKRRMRANRAPHLSVFLSPQVFNAIVREAVLTEWKPLAVQLLEATRELVDQTVGAIFEQATEHVRHFPRLRRYFNARLKQHMVDLYEATKERILNRVSIEATVPQTTNHYLSESMQKLRARVWEQQLLQLKDKDGMIKAEALQACLSKTQGCSVEDFNANEMHNVLVVYAKVAAKRFMDDVPTTIDHDFVRAMVVLGDAFNVDDAVLETLFEGIPEAASRRVRLTADLEALRLAKKHTQALAL